MKPDPRRIGHRSWYPMDVGRKIELVVCSESDPRGDVSENDSMRCANEKLRRVWVRHMTALGQVRSCRTLPASVGWWR